MDRKWNFTLVRALVLATLLLSSSAVAQGGEPQSAAAPVEVLGTSFTYQGRLDQDGTPVDDTCDMRFRLYDAASAGSQVGSTINTGVPIVGGYFTVNLDFGADAFNGQRRWLEIGVDCDGGGYTNLGRQELTAAPQALYAMGAPWSGLSGVPAGFADGVDDDTTYTAGDGLVLNGTEFSAQGNPYANVVVVAKSGGDFASVQAAIDSITDAAEGNAYLVWVAPGVYSETVTMKPYVHLQGAGQEATVISSTVTNASWPPGQATLVLTRSTSLRDLTVGNGGTGLYNTALLAADGATWTLVTDVTARAQGNSLYNNAIYLTGSGTGVTLEHVTGLAENGIYSNVGLINDAGAATMLRGGSFTGRGGIGASGIHNSGSGTMLEATSITALGEDSGTNYGLRNTSATAEIDSSRLTGSDYGLHQYGGTVYLGVTQLDGGAYNNAGMRTCFQVYDENYASHSCNP
jgi:hypothetical protein